MKKLAAIVSGQPKKKETESRLKLLAAANSDNILYLSNASRTLCHGDQAEEVINFYSDLPESVDKIVVMRECAVLYANDFTLSWLTSLLHSQGPETELWLDIPDDANYQRRNLINLPYLQEKLPHADIEEVETKKLFAKTRWIKITQKNDFTMDLQALDTIYPAFHNQWENFFTTYAESANHQGALTPQLRQSASATFIYSLFGANQKSMVFDKILSSHFGDKALRGLDIGGGYGFMAAEICKKGHSMDVTDMDPKKMEKIGPWLADKCDISNQMSFKVEKIEDLIDREGSEEYDFISFVGCLLYAKRELVPDVLQAAMRLLKPGGLLLLHENPKESGKPGTLDYEDRFEIAEFETLLAENAGEPKTYSMFTGAEIPWKQACKAVIMAAIEKK